MQKGLIRKGLVFSVIVLFIGVGIQPALSIESIENEDCIECQVSDGYISLKVNLLLFKIKVVTNVILSSKLGEIPEIKDNCQEILDVINSDNPLDYPDNLCLTIASITVTLAVIIMYFSTLREKNQDNPILFNFYDSIVKFFAIPFLFFANLYIVLGCVQPPPWEE